MSESFREQDPLLCEEFSEEEKFGDYPRRYRPTCRGRARNNVKGAASIITRWPEHTYWWLGVTMVALMIFFIYNSVIAFVLLPTAHTKPAKPRMLNKSLTHLPEVYMHVFTNSNEKMDIHKYLPYIEAISDKYIDFNFNLIILLNDTANEANSLSAEENNELAFNSLWNTDHFDDRKKISNRKNLNINKVTLSRYMNESPLKMDWRKIPEHFMEFIVKAVAIWEKGGVAINPAITVPHSRNAIYMEKLQSILQKYKLPREKKINENKTNKHVNKYKATFKNKVNNIQDIIDNLQHDSFDNYSQDNLTEAEDNNFKVITSSGRKLLSTINVVNNKNNKTNTDLSNYIIVHPQIHFNFENNETVFSNDKNSPNIKIETRELKINPETKFGNLSDTIEIKHTTQLSLLPLFLEFLFHDTHKSNINLSLSNEELIDNHVTRKRKSVTPTDKQKANINVPVSNSNRTQIKSDDQYKPMIVSAKGIPSDTLNALDDIEIKKEQEKKEERKEYIKINESLEEEFTIDLNGNIIATKTPCHAFLGDVFSNIVHHSAAQSLQDFIIAELSLFCKGLLSSCRGIDVILL